MADKEDVRRGFVAERRNLLLTSVVLFLVEYSDLRFERINVLGNEAELGEPNVIRAVIWVFWLYFGWRYYQHYQAINDPSLNETYGQKRNEVVRSISRRRFEQLLEPSPAYPGQMPQINFTSESYQWHSPWHVTIELTGRPHYKLQSGALAADAEKVQKIELPWRDLLWANVKAGSFVLKNMWQFTEYYLPFGVALLPLLYVLSKAIWAISSWLAS